MLSGSFHYASKLFLYPNDEEVLFSEMRLGHISQLIYIFILYNL